MEENEKKHSKALYISIAISLAVISIIIIAASIANKGTQNTPIDSGADIGAGSNSDTLPDFSLPVGGEIAIDYSDSVPVFSQTMNDYRTHLGVDTKHYGDEIHRSWIFRTVGYGNGEEFWRAFVSNLRLCGYDKVLSIEHEDSLMTIDEGLKKAVEFLDKVMIKESKPTGMRWA